MFVKEKAAGEPKVLSKAARVCLKAAELMEKHGICYGRPRQGQHICTGQAIGQSISNLGLRPEIFYIIDRAFQQTAGTTVVGWNDLAMPTTARAVSMLRHVATLV